MRHALIAAVLMTAAVANAQTSQPDAAAAYPAMQKRLATLKAENDELRMANKALAGEVAELKAAVAKMTPAGKPQKAKALKKGDPIETGMTLEQVGQATGCPNPLKTGESENFVFYDFVSGGGTVVAGGKAFTNRPDRWKCTFDKATAKLSYYTKE